MKCSMIHVPVKELLLVADVPVPCNGTLGSLSCDNTADETCYTASYAVQQDDSVTFIVSARVAAYMWVGLGVSDDQMMVSVVCRASQYFTTNIVSLVVYAS